MKGVMFMKGLSISQCIKNVPGPLKISLLAAAVLPISAGYVLAEGGLISFNDQLSEGVKGDWGQIKFNARYRFESVKQDNDLEDADADFIRFKVGYLTPKKAGIQGYIEGLANMHVFADDCNNTVNGQTEYSTISDPDEEALNRAWFSWDMAYDNAFKGGRQYINYDNKRFLMDGAFRQMEQTMDAVTLTNKSLGDLTIQLAYVFGVLNVKNNYIDMNSPLVNVGYSIEGLGTFSAYGYFLDYDEADESKSFAYSTQTLGLRLNGSTAVGDRGPKLLYTAEYANQSDYGDNPDSYDVDYYHLVGGLAIPSKSSFFKNITAKVGYEVLGSEDGISFITPLGANHKFNGWADVFGLDKPADGLEDMYASLTANVSGVILTLAYHDFAAEAGDADYGTEWDVQAKWKFLKNYGLMLCYADYDADEYKVDTEKFWLELTMDF